MTFAVFICGSFILNFEVATSLKMSSFLSSFKDYFKPSKESQEDLEASSSYRRPSKRYRPRIPYSKNNEDTYSNSIADYDSLRQNDAALEYFSKSSGYGTVGHSETACCPLVVDPLSLFSLLGFIGALTALLNSVITMNLMPAGAGRRKRTPSLKADSLGETISTGKNTFTVRRKPLISAVIILFVNIHRIERMLGQILA